MRKQSHPAQQLLLILLLLTCTHSAFSQRKATITGVLQDSIDAKPVAWATVGLYKHKNTQRPLQNLFSNNKGRFEFTDVDTGQYIVIVTYTGYRESRFPVRVDTGMLLADMHQLILPPESKELGGVVVSSAVRKPLLEQDAEKMIFNAEVDPSLEGLTAVDVLRKTPFISVDGDGNVQLNGQSNFKILLNGKETAMFAKNLKDALRSFPAGLIKKVEVSTNPSSKYDGEGVGGIINIITQKKVMGYNGNAGVTYSATNNYSASGSLNIKYGKVGLSAYYGLGGGHPPRSFTYSETESLNPVAFYKRISNGSSRSKNFYNFGDIELGWDVDSLTTLSFYAGVNGGNGNSNGLVQYDMILPNNGGKQTSFLKNESRYRYPGYNLGLDYVRKFSGIEGKELAIKTYYNSAKDDSYALSEQDNPGADRFIINDNKAPNKEMTLQADFTQPFNKGKKLETGVKAILRRASSDYVSLIKYDKDEQYEEDKANSNSFSYLQDVFSVFATYSFKWKTFSVKLGSRYEQTKINGDFTKTATRVKQDYGTFLPNIYLSRKFKKIHTVSLSYTRRLRRPYIWDLNPFVFNTDSFNISYGNPDLGPDIINSFEAGYSVFKGNTNINLRLSQNFSNQQIIHYTNFDEVKGVSANVTENAGIARLSGLNLNLSTKFTKKWAFSAGTGIRYTNLENRFRPTQRNHGFGGFGSLNSSYQATKKWSLYSSCNYYVSDPQLQGQQGKNFTYNFGSNYKLFNQKITVAISASNIFNKYFVWKGKLQDENFIRTNESRSVRRNINFSLRWNFGKLTENVSRKRGVSNDDVSK